jgi:hypothetical protein
MRVKRDTRSNCCHLIYRFMSYVSGRSSTHFSSVFCAVTARGDGIWSVQEAGAEPRLRLKLGHKGDEGTSRYGTFASRATRV